MSAAPATRSHHARAHARSAFRRRLVRALAAVSGIVAVSLAVGIAGYRHFAGLGWVDSFYNASLILSGMGPTDQVKDDAGKIFSGIFALYSGLVLIASTGIVLAPLMNHVLHLFHAEQDESRGN